MDTSAPVLCETKTVSISGHWATASSTVFFKGIRFPPRTPSSAVIRTFAPAKRNRKNQDLVQNNYLNIIQTFPKDSPLPSFGPRHLTFKAPNLFSTIKCMGSILKIEGHMQGCGRQRALF